MMSLRKIFNNNRKYADILTEYISKKQLNISQTIDVYLGYLKIVDIKKYNSVKEYIEHLGIVFKKAVFNNIKEYGIQETIPAALEENLYYKTVDRLDNFIKNYQ